MIAAGRGRIASASPYKGLTHFTEEDAALFFGRAREREVIVANLKARRLTLLYGESGVGKSSLLRAGVMRALSDAARRDLDDEDVARPEYVPAIVASWSGEPLGTLLDTLPAAVAPFVREPLPSALPDRLDAAIDVLAARADTRLVVILDQLEEYFLYHGDEQGEGTLADELPRALARPHLRASFLLSIREDALAKLDRFKRRVPDLFDTVLRIGPLDREAARQAIVGPLRAFDGPGPKNAEPALVEAILDQVGAGQLLLEGSGQGRVHHDGAAHATRTIEAPYLQLVLARLWEEENDPDTLGRATLDRLGGAEAIVRRHLDEALASLDEPERVVAADALRYLVTPSGTKIALAAPDLASFTGRPDVAPVLEKLTGAGARVLRAVGAPPGQANATRYEIAHDVLGAAVLDWRSRFVAEQERLELERRAVAEREQLEREKREAEEREAAERRRARTFRALAGVAFALLLAAGAFLAYAFVEKGRAEHSQRVSEAQARAAEARNALDEGRLDAAIPLALAAYRGSRAAGEDTLLAAVQQSSGLRRLLRFGGPVAGMAVDPLGRDVAAAVGRTLVVRTVSGRAVARVSEPADIGGVAFSADGTFLAAARADGAVAFFRVRRDRLGRAVALDRRPPLRSGQGVAKSVAFSPDGHSLAAGTDGGVVVWPLRGGSSGSPTRLGPTGFARAVAFCPGSDGRAGAVAAAFGDGRVVLWPSATRGTRGRIMQSTGPSAGAVACSPHGNVLAAAGDDRLVTLYSVARRAKLGPPLTGHKDRIEALAFSHDGSILTSGADDDSVILWDVRRPHDVRELRPPLHAHAAPVVAVGFDRRGATLAAASGDGRVSIWNADAVVRARGGIHVAADHLNAAAFGDGIVAAATSRDQVLVRSAARPEVPGPVSAARFPHVTAVAIDAGGHWLALGFPTDVHLFRLGRATPREEMLGGRTGVDRLGLARDGALAAALPNGAIRVWRRPRLRSAFHDLRPPGAPPRTEPAALAITPAGGTVAAAYGSRVVLWRPGERAVALEGTPGRVGELAFGREAMLAGAAGGAVALWDAEKGRRLALLRLPAGEDAAAVAFSPDGRWLASAGQRARIWDLAARRHLGEPLPTPSGASVAALAFTGPATLSAAYSDGTAAAWDLERWRLRTNFDGIRASLLSSIGRAGAVS